MRLSHPRSLPYSTYLCWRLDTMRQSPLVTGHTHPFPHLLPFPIPPSTVCSVRSPSEKPKRGMMIQWDDCQGWIHGPCANLGLTEATALHHFSCSTCSLGLLALTSLLLLFLHTTTMNLRPLLLLSSHFPFPQCSCIPSG